MQILIDWEKDRKFLNRHSHIAVFTNANVQWINKTR